LEPPSLASLVSLAFTVVALSFSASNSEPDSESRTRFGDARDA